MPDTLDKHRIEQLNDFPKNCVSQCSSKLQEAAMHSHSDVILYFLRPSAVSSGRGARVVLVYSSIAP